MATAPSNPFPESSPASRRGRSLCAAGRWPFPLSQHIPGLSIPCRLRALWTCVRGPSAASSQPRGRREQYWLQEHPCVLCATRWCPSSPGRGHSSLLCRPGSGTSAVRVRERVKSQADSDAQVFHQSPGSYTLRLKAWKPGGGGQGRDSLDLGLQQSLRKGRPSRVNLQSKTCF